MKQKIFLIIIFIVVSTCNLLAQGEAAHWHFGQKAGMDFTDMYTANNVTINGTVNQPLSGIPRFEAGPIITLEGCFSISDKNGNLLFSSDGRYVYNKNKQLMPNGSNLKGNASATQSGIVIPRPEHPDNYYIVTAPAFEGARTGLFYYEVDMKLDGGKGDVVVMEGTSDIKENPLNFGGIYPVTQAGENLAAIGHANGKEYWLVHRCRGYFLYGKSLKMELLQLRWKNTVQATIARSLLEKLVIQNFLLMESILQIFAKWAIS